METAAGEETNMNKESEGKAGREPGRRARALAAGTTLSAAVLLVFLAGAASAERRALRVGHDDDHDLRRYAIQKTEEIKRTLSFPAGAAGRKVVLDNVWGGITVIGADVEAVELSAVRTDYAETGAAYEKARAEVTLDISEKDGAVDIYVDGPFRCDDGRRRFRRHRDPGYEVHYDFTLRVPRRVDLSVSTVTSGRVEVSGVEGTFDIGNVNGRVRLVDIAGRGSARTVNGRLDVGFRRPPAGDCDFKTVNGEVLLELPGEPSADFRLKTFNGEIFSDFPVSYLPAKPATSTRRDGKYVYKSDRSFGVRAGRGGPEIRLDTLNGDILIKKAN